jgi:hypothetical protein
MSPLDFPRPLPPKVKYLEGVAKDGHGQDGLVLDEVGDLFVRAKVGWGIKKK